MWRIVGVLAAVLTGTAHGQPPESDPVVQAGVDQLASPCSCDCCQVGEAPPEEQVMTDDGTELHFKCTYSNTPDESVESTCPNSCRASNADHTLNLNSAVTDVDYARFCPFYCKPSSPMLGSTCTRLTAEEMHAVSTPDGNGKATMFEPLTSASNSTEDDSGGFGELSPEAAAAKREKAAKDAAAAAELDQQVIWDMRKLVAERMRAEAGGSMSREAASQAHVQSNAFAAERAATLSKRVQQAIQPFEATLGESLGQTRVEAEGAEESAQRAEVVEKEAEREAENVVEDTRKLAVQEIEKQAEPAAKRLAEAEVILHAWDKPEGYSKVLGNRAAAPYLKEMVNAVQRVSEYEGMAKGFLAQAQAAQSQAATLATQANAARSVGDKLNEAVDRKKVNDLLAKSKSLDAEAHKVWNVADLTRKTIPEWQAAGAKAAAHTAWEFELALTPSP